MTIFAFRYIVAHGYETKLYLNSKLRTDVEQMSTPLPANPENVPPMKPVKIKTTACQTPKSGISLKVFRLCCLKNNFKYDIRFRMIILQK